MAASREKNPRIKLLRDEVERGILMPFRSHGWEANIVCEHDKHDSLEISASKKDKTVRFGVVYSSATANAHYKELAQHAAHIFFSGQPYRLNEFTHGINVPVESLDEFFPFLVSLNRQVEPQSSGVAPKHIRRAVRRIMDENPLASIMNHLEQFKSATICRKLIESRAEHEKVSISSKDIVNKASGVAYSMRNALDYMSFPANERLNRRILSMYYGSVAFAFAEMLASPNGPLDLVEVEQMTKSGHGLYTLPGESGNFADLRVGVLATGFLPQWLAFLGYDTTVFPKRKPKSIADFDAMSSDVYCTLQQLFSSIPEIEDLFSSVFNIAPNWVIPVYDVHSNSMPIFGNSKNKPDSAYVLLYDNSGLIPINKLETAGWPLAEIQPHKSNDSSGNVFRARVDHSGHKLWWDVMPTHSSPFNHRTTLLFPTIGGMRDYRTIATALLYALSIMVRYMPSVWRRIEGGVEDQYLALVNAALNVWERILPELFLESITDEECVANQPGSFFS